MKLETRLNIPKRVVSRLVGDETVLLDLATGVYFGLDSVGQSIWACVADGKSVAETIEAIVAEYDVDEARARKDVVDFAKGLVDRGLLSQ